MHLPVVTLMVAAYLETPAASTVVELLQPETDNVKLTSCISRLLSVQAQNPSLWKGPSRKDESGNWVPHWHALEDDSWMGGSEGGNAEGRSDDAAVERRGNTWK